MAKLTDKQFFAILRENGGLFSRTSRAIKKEYKIDFTRQSVRERALKSPDILADIKGENVDIAEEGIHSLMRSKNERVRLNACEFYLKTIGAERGYNEKLLVDHTTKGESMNNEKTIIVFKDKRKKGK